MSLCSQLGLGLESNSCPQPGGLNKRVWAGFVADRTGDGSYVTLPTTGEVSAFALKTGKKLVRYIGEKLRNTAGSSVQREENGFVDFAQTLTLRLFYANQTELEEIEKLIKAQELTFFVQQNTGKIRVFGLEYGLACSTSEEQFGTQIREGSGWFTLTFTGNENQPAKFFRSTATSTVAEDITYLDTMLVAAV